MARREYVNEYMNGQNRDNLSLVPRELYGALAKRCFNVLHMNRGGKLMEVNMGKKGDPVLKSRILFALNTLYQIGYTQEIVTVKKGDIVWRRIQRTNKKTGSYAIMQCSQKLEVTQNYRVCFIFPPKNEDGTNKYTDSFHPSFYMSGDTWTFAHTGGSPYVGDKTLNFNPWDEPYPCHKQDGILLELEQDPNH